MADSKQLAVESTRLAQLNRAYAAQTEFSEAFARIEALLSTPPAELDAMERRLRALGAPPTP